jgi:pimeloyl-ACP methyl ester carboxylesterase
MESIDYHSKAINLVVAKGVYMPTDFEWLKNVTPNLFIIETRQETEELTVLDLAIDIFDEILKLGLSEFHLLGFDLGGMAILQLGILLKGRDDLECKGICVIGSSPVPPNRGLFLTLLDKPREFITKCVDGENIEEYVKNANSMVSEDIYIAILGFDVSHQLARLTIPLLIVHGSGRWCFNIDDKLIDPLYAHMIHDMVPNSKLNLISGGSHWISSEILYHAIEQFIK